MEEFAKESTLRRFIQLSESYVLLRVKRTTTHVLHSNTRFTRFTRGHTVVLLLGLGLGLVGTQDYR